MESIDLNKGIEVLNNNLEKGLISQELYNSAVLQMEDLEKAKYFKREGTPGHYKYYYSEAEYKDKKEGKTSEGEKEVEHKHNLKPGEQVKLAGGKLGKVLDIKGNSVRTSETGQDYVHIAKLFRSSGEAVIKESKIENKNKHISDMTPTEIKELAKKKGISIENKKMSEIKRELSDKNIDEQLEEFRKKKESEKQ